MDTKKSENIHKNMNRNTLSSMKNEGDLFSFMVF